MADGSPASTKRAPRFNLVVLEALARLQRELVAHREAERAMAEKHTAAVRWERARQNLSASTRRVNEAYAELKSMLVEDV